VTLFLADVQVFIVCPVRWIENKRRSSAISNPVRKLGKLYALTVVLAGNFFGLP
jgi:hypothetical protein